MRSIASRNTARKPTSSDPATKKKARRARTASRKRLPRAMACLDVENQAGRILERFLDGDERQHRLAPIDDAVVVRERQVVDRPDHDLAVLDHRTLLGRVHA